MIKVLDNGFVELVDSMGDDSAIVQAARVSYGEGTKTPSTDTQLIRYLLRHRHTTPFEMVELKFRVMVPMDCWRQWIRHRTANVNEYSTRYSEAIDVCAKTSEWRSQSKSNKQGSGEFITEWPEDWAVEYAEGGTIVDIGDEELYPIPIENATVVDFLNYYEAEFQAQARDVYELRLKAGVAREQARKDLPLSTYTIAYWKIDLHNLFHFLGLRMDSHAQFEIRQYANAIYDLIKPIVPIACQAFSDYRLEAMFFTAKEVDWLKEFMIKVNIDILDLGEITEHWTKREQNEFRAKLSRLCTTD